MFKTKNNSASHRLAANMEKIQWNAVAIFLSGMILAIALRYSLLDFKSLDYFASLKPWYNTIKSEGFSAFATNFSTYNPPYLYLLYLIARFFPDIPTLTAVKIPALIADFVGAYFVYRIVRLEHENYFPPLLAGMAVLFAPTVVLNSAFWGQADSLFTAGLLACVYYLMTQKYTRAFAAFGIALAFKLQAVFLLPLLLALFLRRAFSWKNFLFLPLLLLSALAPSWMAGRPILDLLNIYLFQTSQFESITMNAPSIYAWLPATKRVFNLFYLPGILAGITAAFMFIVIVYKSSKSLSKSLTLELALISTLLVPFFLPKMHDRYFYPADVISIALAFYSPRFFYVPALVVGASFFAYQPFLFGVEPVPMPILTAILLLAISILTYDAAKLLYSSTESEDSDAVLGGTDNGDIENPKKTAGEEE